MPAAFSGEFKEQVRTQTDIVALISESVRLQAVRGGREFVGLCPFHDDHTPSMRVYPDRQSFRCEACNEGGDCFSYVMKHERVEFPEALEMLAQRLGLQVPKSHRPQDALPADSKQRLLEALAWAEQEFHRCLLKDAVAERARNYLAERGISADSIATFRLGYHPPGWDWLLRRAGQKFTPEQLLQVRLVGKREPREGESSHNVSARYYDYFGDRVLFPIRDNRGRPVAFGGRVLPDSPPTTMGKYWNSPESPVFNKSRLLYGLDRARDRIVADGVAVVVEGYTDCILAHQAGLTNFVGTMGTALAETHVQTLKRFCRQVVLVYDGDSAGQSATERSLGRFLSQEVDLRILTLPGDQDPADYLLEHGGEALKKLLAGAQEAWEHKYQTVVARWGLESIDSRHRVLEEMLDVLAQVPGRGPVLAASWQMRENVILGRLAQRLRVSEEIVRQRLFEMRQQGAAATNAARRTPAGNPADAEFSPDPTSPSPARVSTANPTPPIPLREPVSPDEILDRELLEIAFAEPQTLPLLRRELPPSFQFTWPVARKFWELLLRFADAGEAPSFERLLAELADPQQKSLAVAIDEHGRQMGVTAALVPHTLAACRQRARTRALQTEFPTAPATSSLDPEALARLRQSAQLHQQRIAPQNIPT